MLKVSEILEDQILFYDLETDHQYAPYANIRLIGVQYGFGGQRETVRTFGERQRFKAALLNPAVLKVGFNCCNFDDIILTRHGYKMHEASRHDIYLMIKTIHPKMPSYGLKFLCWWIFGDHHWPEYELERNAKKTQTDKWTKAPDEYLEPYLAHDLSQHCNLFSYAWDIVQRPVHWSAYLLDLAVGSPLEEMTNRGGIYVNREYCQRRIVTLLNRKKKIENYAFQQSDGEVRNPNSSKQLGKYFNSEGFELELSANGDFSVRKSDLLEIEIKSKNPVARSSLVVRKVNSDLKYYENYLEAANYETQCKNNLVRIPIAYSISNARTRRFTSSSRFGINFQNADKHAKSIWHVPEGWLGWWIDSTQIENVVHIYESKDIERRRDYEADSEWSEYVWLCNRILGGTPRTKWELDHIPSPQTPNWSIYKQYKTVKLMLNFGAGIAKFCTVTGIDKATGTKLFRDIHEVCPAIHQLQDRVRKDLLRDGHVTDPFGHRYYDIPNRAYKCVAYLIQGCGTGSLPKAQIRSNYETIHSFDKHSRSGCAGFMCSTTHDDNGGRINLDLHKLDILHILRELMQNMTTKYSPKFDNIPLRAKLYLSRTTAAQATEVDLTKPETYERYFN